MNADLLLTPLHDWHVARAARMVPFAGWSMPVQYRSIRVEHQAVREGVGAFDISHMGRIGFRGAQAGAFLDHLLTRKATSLKPGQIRYGLVTNRSGGILDDVLVYRLEAPGEPPDFRLVVNASNREKIVAWLESHRSRWEVDWTDDTLETAMIAVQGPRALATAQAVLGDSVELESLAYYTGCVLRDPTGPWPAGEWVVSRTGYTGEDGCELVVPRAAATALWEAIIDRGATPAGLGARDTLRLEAAMPLYGHELDESIDPIEAGLGFAVQFKDHEFVGRAALEARKAAPPQRVRVGIEAEGKRVPRQGAELFRQGAAVGTVTSGTFSPTLEKSIAMAYVAAEHAEPGTTLEVDIRGKRAPAVVVPLPFYRRAT